ncbi:hypothetical protein K1719_041702 [Acacia pycnantha]|nr:hypothetical protein K1719_041702 [Acacia pycnantha]
MSNLVAIRDPGIFVDGNDDLNSPAKQKAANRGAYGNRSTLSLRRAIHMLGTAKTKLFLGFCALSIVVVVTSRHSSWVGWNPYDPSSVSSPSRGGYTVLMNTWKQNSFLKEAVAHYASCFGTDAINVVWSEIQPPSEHLKTYLEKIVVSKSRRSVAPNFRFDVNGDDNFSRFKPIDGHQTDAIFSVDDDVIVPCSTLDFAFSVWQSAPFTMVGFVPRMHWLDKEQNNVAYYRYGGWWSVWRMGTYSMVLSKAAFIHWKYLDLYAHMMPLPIQDYISRHRNCEDVAMSFLVANSTGAPPIWVKGKIYEKGASSISNPKGRRSDSRDRCLNDLISLYGTVPLVPTHFKAVSAKNEWLW